MAIINSTNEGLTYNNLTSNAPYFWCTYSDGVVRSKSSQDDDGNYVPNLPNTYVSTKLELFGADTMEELEAEILRLELT